MTTGDLKNNLRKLHSELKLVNYYGDLDIEGLSIGKPSAFLPILHFILVDFSLELAQYLYSKDYELLGKSDMKFINVVYRILRDEFHLKVTLTKEQFFTLGFSERKLQLVTSIVHLCRKKSEELKPKRRRTVAGLNTGKIPRNKLSVFQEKITENSQKLPKPVTMTTTSKTSAQPLIPDSDHVNKRNWETQTTTAQTSNAVIEEAFSSNIASDPIPRKMPVAYDVPKQIPRISWCTVDEETNKDTMKSKYLVASSKENILLNNYLSEQINIPQASIDRNSNFVEKVDEHNTMPRYATQHKEKAFFVDNGKPPKDIYVNVINKDEGNVNSSETDLVASLDKLTTGQDSEAILKHFKAQQSQIEDLERNKTQSDMHIQELVKRNSELSARVMVLETAVTLLQEKMDQ